MSSALVAALLLLLGSGRGGAGSSSQPLGDPSKSHEAQVSGGEFLYRTYCMSCHGERARGDGPVASELRTRPADLAQISARNGGEFPASRVHRQIDGRSEVTAHGPSEMPVWGFAFQQRDSDTDQEDEVRQRIRQLVSYLESIQIPEDR